MIMTTSPFVYQIQEPTPFAKMIGERVTAAIADLRGQRERFMAKYADLVPTHTIIEYPLQFMRSAGPDDDSVKLSVTQLVVLIPKAFAEDHDFSMPAMDVLTGVYPYAELVA